MLLRQKAGACAPFAYIKTRPVARGGSGGSYDPPMQLPIPKILFHPLAILFHPLAILFHLSAILFHPLAILFHLSAILFHPLAILFHPSAILFHPLAILFHPWNMWMTSHGQCPRGGGACECPRVGAFFKLITSHGQCPRGGACECPRVGAFFKLMTSRGQCPRGGCAWCSTHPSSDPPPPPPGWLATGLKTLHVCREVVFDYRVLIIVPLLRRFAGRG